MTRSWLVFCFVLVAMPLAAQNTYYNRVTGKLLYKNGSEQPFTGFRCFYSNKLYYSQDTEALKKDNYRTASTANLEQITRIDFTDRPTENVRRGTVSFRNGEKLNAFFYVEECKWANGSNVEGQMNDAAITALVFTTQSKP